MGFLANLVVLLIALLHGYILVLEMFFWTTPRAMRAFGTSLEFAKASAPLAANQGLYNGFLAAGLLWGLFTGAFAIKVFFLLCVLVAGVYGSLTVVRRIFYIQALPAAIALILLLLSR